MQLGPTQLSFESIDPFIAGAPVLVESEDNQLDLASREGSVEPVYEPRVPRTALVAALMQDRGVLRLLCAPHNFGKTELALEYANRLFKPEQICVLQAFEPDFLCILDAPQLREAFCKQCEGLGILLLDDLSYLDAERAAALSEIIDHVLRCGVEVVVTCVPSCDCLSRLQLDRVVLGARDLLVSERECSGIHVSAGVMTNARLREDWLNASKRMFGLVPAVFWEEPTAEYCLLPNSKDDEFSPEQMRCLVGLFLEQMPLEFLNTILFMLLTGSGSLDALASYGLGTDFEIEALLANEYPCLGVDSTKHTYALPSFKLGVLPEALARARRDKLLHENDSLLLRQALVYLFRQGDIQRSMSILDALCTPSLCALWLAERGWELLDCAELDFLEHIFARIETAQLMQNAGLLALYAWLVGVQGNASEALLYAQKALDLAEKSAWEAATARLCVCAFGSREHYSAWHFVANAPETIESTQDFLLAVAANCTPVDVARAFCAANPDKLAQLEADRKPAATRCVRSLRKLLAQPFCTMTSGLFERIALLLCANVDNAALRAEAVNKCADLVWPLCRNEARTFSEAALVNVMFFGGKFGANVEQINARDKRLLSSAACVLRKFAAAAGHTNVEFAWEKPTRRVRKTNRSGSRTTGEDGIDLPPLTVNLFGAIDVSVGTLQIAVEKMSRKSRILLAALVLNHGHEQTSTYYSNALWPNLSKERAKSNFYAAWSGINRTLGASGYLVRRSQFCALNTRLLQSDWQEFERLSKQIVLDRHNVKGVLDCAAVMHGLFEGGLLPSEQTHELILPHVKHAQQIYVDAMLVASGAALDSRNATQAMWFAERACEQGVAREDAFMALMRAQVLAGRRSQALSTFFKCRDFLREDLGLDPSADMERLYVSILDSTESLPRGDSPCHEHATALALC